MARLLARGGHRVLAIDGDANPNLALTLGIGAERVGEMPTLSRDLLRRTEGGVAELTQTLDEVCATHSTIGPDGVTLLIMAHPQHAGTGCLCGLHATVRTVIGAASDDPHDVCILDTEASPEHLSRGTAKYADALLAVVEPYYKSLETGRRMAMLAKDLGLPRVALVANKLRDERDEDVVAQFASQCGLELAGRIPFDDLFADAERAGVAPLDFREDAEQAPAIMAIGRLAAEWGVDGRA